MLQIKVRRRTNGDGRSCSIARSVYKLRAAGNRIGIGIGFPGISREGNGDFKILIPVTHVAGNIFGYLQTTCGVGVLKGAALDVSLTIAVRISKGSGDKGNIVLGIIIKCNGHFHLQGLTIIGNASLRTDCLIYIIGIDTNRRPINFR